MNISKFLFLIITSFSFSQKVKPNDSLIQITFYLPELDSAYQIHPLNGLYPKKNCEKPKIHPKGTIYINPFDQGTNQNQFGITVNPDILHTSWDEASP